MTPQTSSERLPHRAVMARLFSLLVYAMFLSRAHISAMGTSCTAEAPCPERCNCKMTPSGNMLVNCDRKNMLELPSILPANTEKLIFAKNNLTALPDKAFQECHKLLHLDLSKNLIQNVSETAFRGMTGLQTLLLNHNRIDFNTAPVRLFEHVPLLSGLWINDNSESPEAVTYNDQLFTPLKNLRILRMDGLRNATFGPGFSSLEKLESLTMRGNFMYITNDTFRNLGNCSLKTFKARSLVLTDVDVLAFAHFEQLQVLDLSSNPRLGFTNVSKSWYGLQFTKISELVLERSAPYDYQIITIERAFFKYLELTQLKKLVLDANNIITIEAVFSFHTRHLEYLSVAYNRLVQLLGLALDLFFLPNLTTVQGSFQSKRLWSSDGWPHISKIETDNSLNIAPNKADLPVLDWKQAQAYIPTIYSNLTLLRELHYEGSLLIEGVGYISKTMPLPSGPMFFLSPPALENFQVAATWTEDYIIFPRTTIFGTNQLHILNYSMNNMDRFVGPLVMKISPPKKLVIDLSKNDCIYLDPGLGSDIGAFIGTLFLCDNSLGAQLANDTNGTILRHFTEVNWLDLASNNIKTLPNGVFRHQSKLQRLDLSYNSLRLVDFAMDHMTNLSFLDLAGNLLDELSLQTRTSLDLAARSRKLTVNLKRNPFQCSCDELEFLKWVPRSKVELLRWKRYVCTYNGRLVRLSDLESIILPQLQVDCHSKTWVIAVAVAFVGILLLILASIFLYRHRFEIRYLCLRLIINRRKYEALEEQDKQYEFDVFVAFDQSDLQWIQDDLVPQLDSKDGEGDFKLMIHHRDFLPGERIDENILRGIQNSRKIILVLSREFVESNWCDFELQMAQMRCFDEGKELIVPVLLEENLPTLKLTRSLRGLLRRNTYLMWPEDANERSNFWRNLKRALASKPDRIIRCQCGQTMTV